MTPNRTGLRLCRDGVGATHARDLLARTCGARLAGAYRGRVQPFSTENASAAVQ